MRERLHTMRNLGATKNLLRQVCHSRNIGYDDTALAHLLENYYIKANRGLRACHPRDIVDEAVDIARYLGLPRQLTPDLIDRACQAYFVEM